MRSKIHAGLFGFLEKRGFALDAQRSDEAIVINSGRACRVYCRPAPHGDLVLESRLRQLPESPSEQNDLISQCLSFSWTRMGTHCDYPVLSESNNQLLLRQRLPSDATVDEVEKSLECFVRSIVDWRRILRIL